MFLPRIFSPKNFSTHKTFNVPALRFLAPYFFIKDFPDVVRSEGRIIDFTTSVDIRPTFHVKFSSGLDYKDLRCNNDPNV